MCIQEPLLISKKIIVLLHTLSAYNSLLVHCKSFTRLIPENVCVQAERMLKPMKTLVLSQRHVERILYKNKVAKLNFQPLLLRENYTEIKARQLKFP